MRGRPGDGAPAARGPLLRLDQLQPAALRTTRPDRRRHRHVGRRRATFAPGPARLFDYDQTHILTAVGSYDLGRGFEIGARLRYATGFPRTPVVDSVPDLRRGPDPARVRPVNSIRLPSFFQADVRVAKRLRIDRGRWRSTWTYRTSATAPTPRSSRTAPTTRRATDHRLADPSRSGCEVRMVKRMTVACEAIRAGGRGLRPLAACTPEIVGHHAAGRSSARAGGDRPPAEAPPARRSRSPRWSSDRRARGARRRLGAVHGPPAARRRRARSPPTAWRRRPGARPDRDRRRGDRDAATDVCQLRPRPARAQARSRRAARRSRSDRRLLPAGANPRSRRGRSPCDIVVRGARALPRRQRHARAAERVRPALPPERKPGRLRRLTRPTTPLPALESYPAAVTTSPRARRWTCGRAARPARTRARTSAATASAASTRPPMRAPMTARCRRAAAAPRRTCGSTRPRARSPRGANRSSSPGSPRPASSRRRVPAATRPRPPSPPTAQRLDRAGRRGRRLAVVVLRDARGGVAWSTYRLRVE